MFSFTNLSNIFLQEHFWVTAAKRLKQFCHSLILAWDLSQQKVNNTVFVS